MYCVCMFIYFTGWFQECPLLDHFSHRTLQSLQYWKKNPPKRKLAKSVKWFNKFNYHHLQKWRVQDLGQWVITLSRLHGHVQYWAICLAIITSSKLNIMRTWSDNIKTGMFPILLLNDKLLSYQFWLKIPSFFIHLFLPIPTSNLVPSVLPFWILCDVVLIHSSFLKFSVMFSYNYHFFLSSFHFITSTFSVLTR